MKQYLFLFVFLMFIVCPCADEQTNNNTPHISNPDQVIEELERVPFEFPVLDILTGDEIVTVQKSVHKYEEWIRINLIAEGYHNKYVWTQEGNYEYSSLMMPLDKSLLRKRAWKNENAPQLILLQFDGMTSQVFQDGLSMGLFPATELLLEKGTWGLLESCCDTVSPIVWTTIDTGFGPKENGVTGFLALDPETGAKINVTSSFIRRPRLWDLVRANGHSAIVGGILLPDPGDDFLQIREINDSPLLHARKLAKKIGPKVVVIYNREPDDAGHFWWNTYEPEKFAGTLLEPSGQSIEFNGPRLLQAYKNLDAWVATALFMAGPNTVIFAMSDHGFEISNQQLLMSANHFLELMNLDGLRSCDIDSPNELVFCADPGIKVGKYVKKIKRAKTKTGFAPFEMATCRDDTGFDKSQNPNIALRIVLNMEKITMAFVNGESISLKGKTIPIEQFLLAGTSGQHFQFGMFLVAGKGIKPGAKINSARVIDVMPTNLAILGMPVAEDMEGRVLIELFKAPRHINKIPTYGTVEKERIIETPSVNDLEKLKSLGYIN